MSLSCFPGHVTAGCLPATFGVAAFGVAAWRASLGLSPTYRPAAHHIARHATRLWLWHMAIMGHCTHCTHGNSYHMPRLCHTHCSPAPGASTCGQEAPRSRAHVEPESMQRRPGATREASATPHVRRRRRVRHRGDGGWRDGKPGERFGAWTGPAVGSLMSRARTAAGAKTTGPFLPIPPAPAMRFPSLTPPFPSSVPHTWVSFLGVLPLTFDP